MLRYQQGWKALNRLLHEDHSFSGHERHCVFLNTRPTDASGQFACISATSGLDFPEDGRAVVATDWDFDGKLDLWITHRTAPRIRLMRNQIQNDNHFLAVRLVGDGRQTNRDAIGARVELRLAEDPQRPLIKTVYAGDAFVSQTGAWLQFGLGTSAKISSLSVHWPGGEKQSIAGVKIDGRYVIDQASGKATQWTPPANRHPLQPAIQELAKPDPRARIVLAAPLLLPTIHTQGNSTSVNQRFQGQTLIALWSTTCVPCLHELQSLTEAKPRLDAAGIDVVAINLDRVQSTGDDNGSSDSGSASDDDQAAVLLKRIGFPYAAEYGTLELVKSLDVLQRAILDRWKDLAVPTSFLVDEFGTVRAIYQGAVDVDQLVQDARLAELSDADLRDAAAPFAGSWIGGPPGPEPLQVTSKFIDARMATEGLAYLRRYAELADSIASPEAKVGIADLFYVMGVLLRDQNELDGAKNSFEQAIRYNPTDFRTHSDMASLAAQTGDFPRAAKALTDALTIKPDDVNTVRKMALVRMSQGQLPEAIKLFRQVVSTNPRDVAVIYNLANALRSVGEIQESLKLYRQVLEIDDRMILAANNLAWIQATHPDAQYRNGKEALRWATHICEITKYRQPDALDTLAAAQAESGDFDSAVKTAESAAELAKAAKNNQLEQAMHSRAELYREKKPYRDQGLATK